MRLPSLLTAALVVSLPALASAATFQIFSDPVVPPPTNLIGTFEAPIGGGLISNLLIEQSGVIFDIRTDGGAPIEYDAAANDFRVPGDSSFTYTNSMNFPGLCGPGGCFLQVFPLPDDPTVPGDIFAIDAALNNIDEGTRYVIAPIPLPAAGILLLGAVAGLGMVRLRERPHRPA